MPAAPPLRLVSYVPEARWDFYGGDVMVEAAQAVGDAVHLTLAGAAPDSRRPLPTNVHLVGHVEDFPALISRSHVLIRMVEHDALGATVIEALQLKRHVVYSYQLEGARHVAFGDVAGLISVLRDLEQLCRCGELGLNDDASSWLDRRSYDGDAGVILRAVTDAGAAGAQPPHG